MSGKLRVGLAALGASDRSRLDRHEGTRSGSHVGIATDMAIESENIDDAVIEGARRAAARLGEMLSAD
jgi:hypothetical protein